MDGQMFERKYVEYALSLARKKNMNQSEFAHAVWPHKTEAAATTTIIALKRQNSRGKPQNLRVSDAIRMAEILDKEYPSMNFEVWERCKLEAGEKMEEVVPPKNENSAQKTMPGSGESLQRAYAEAGD